MNTDRDWLIKKAAQEDGCEVAAGAPDTRGNRLERRVAELEDALEQFRMWLAQEILEAGAPCGISDDPVTVCLTIARGRIDVLKQENKRLKTRYDEACNDNLLALTFQEEQAERIAALTAQLTNSQNEAQENWQSVKRLTGQLAERDKAIAEALHAPQC